MDDRKDDTQKLPSAGPELPSIQNDYAQVPLSALPQATPLNHCPQDTLSQGVDNMAVSSFCW